MKKVPSINYKLPTNNSLKIGQASKALGVSIDTLRRWEASGKIQAQRTEGGTRVYSPFVKIGEAAKVLGVSIDTLRRWEKAGKIAPVRTPGSTRLYSLEELRKINPQPNVILGIRQLAETPESGSWTSQDDNKQVPSTLELLQKKAIPEPQQDDYQHFSHPVALDTLIQQKIDERLKPEPDFENLVEPVNKPKKIYAKIYAGATLCLIFLLLGTLSFWGAKQLQNRFWTSQNDNRQTRMTEQNVLAASSIAEIGKFLEINADTVITGNMAVNGESVFGEGVTIQSTLDVDGATTLSTASTSTLSVGSTLSVNGLSTLTGGLTTPGKITLTGNEKEILLIKPTSDPSSATKLFVIQNAAGTEKASIDNNGNALFAGTLNVSGATILSSTISVSGATTLSSSLEVSGTSTLSGAVVGSSAGAASTPGLKLTGAWYTGGSTTTSKPQFLVEPTDTTSTGWSASGTGIGVNAKSAFTGNLLDLQLAGTSKFKVDYQGTVTAAGTITFSGLTASRAVFTDSSSNLATTGASAALLNALSDETGTGLAVFGTSPTITTSLVTDSTTFALVNTTATTLNIGGGATTGINMGNASGTTTLLGSFSQSGSGTFGTGTGAVSLNGDTTIAANKNLALTSGTGTFTQTYSNTTGTATTHAITNSASSGTTTVKGLAVNITGTANATGTNTITGIDFANVAAATNNTYYGLNFGTGFSDILRYNGTTVINGTGQVVSTQLTGTLFSNSSDSNSGTNTIIQGDTLAISGGTNGIDTSLSNDTYTINFDSTEVGTTTWGVASAIVWTFDAGSVDPTIDFNSGGIVFNEGGADIDLRVEGDTATSLFVADAGLDAVQITPSGTRASAAGATWDGFSIPASTATITGSTNITTATGFNLVNIGQPTLSNASITVTNAATMYIANSPTVTGGMPAITNPYALWVDDGNVRFDGTANTVGTITSGTWNGTDIALADGGTNASLTASNGGIFYSTATAGAILAGTATANQVLLSGASTTPAWSTATYPATTTVSQLLYSSSTNVIAGLATANSGVLVTGGTGIPAIATDIPTAVTIGTAYIYRAGGTDVAVADGGTNCSVASITCFNNITGYTAAGATGTTSTNLVFSTSPALTTPTVVTSIVGGTSFDAFNTVSTTLNIGGAATTLSIGAAASATTWTGQSFTLTGANTTNNTTLTVQNTTNTAVAAHSILDIAVGGITSTGDPQLRLTVPSGTSRYLAIDNSDSDKFMIGRSTTVGTTADLTIDTSGNVGIGTTAPDAALEINHATGDSLRLSYNDSDGSAANYTDFSISSTGALTLTGSTATLGASATAEKTFLTLTPGTITLTAPTAVTSLMETAVFTGATIAADAATTVNKATGLSLTAPIDSTNATLTNSSALRILTTTSGAGTMTTNAGLYVEAQSAGATNNYGIYIEEPTGGATANVGLYNAGTSTLAGAVTINTSLLPDADDGAVLGASGSGFSDLFLASGAVINFAAGDVTLTHGTDVLTIGGGNVDLGNNLIVNIGAAGTDFTANGGLTLAELLTVNDDVDFVFDAGENLNINASSTANTTTAGVIDLNVSSATDSNRGLDIAYTHTATGATTSYGAYNAWASTAVVAGVAVSQTGYGIYSTAAKTGADTATGTYSLYGLYSTASNTGRTDAGTVNTYGGYFDATGDASGTSSVFGLYLADVSGGDTNVALCFDCDGTYSASTVASGIQFGTDANAVTLYRSASDILRTGDGLTVDLDLIVSGGDITGTGDEGIDIGEATTNAITLLIDAAGEVILTSAALSPSTSDGNALGTTALMWSDLFLASGGVINFNNGDVTLTHGTDILTIGGGNVDLGNNLIVNIGAAGTDFTANGGLTLAELLTVNDDVDFVFDAGENLNINASSTANTTTAGVIDLNVSSATDSNRGLDIAYTHTATGATTSYGAYNAWASTAVVAGVAVSQTGYGIYSTAAKTGADTATGTYSLYGLYSTASNTGRTDAGTVNTYGGYFDATGDASGTATAYSLYIDPATGADTNYGLYAAGGNSYFATTQTVASGASATLDAFNIPASTITVSGSTNITTATGFNLINIGQPTYSNATIAVSNAATLYIANAPTASGGGSITNPYALWVDAGNVRFDGVLQMPTGSESAPNYTFQSDTDTGMYSASAGYVDIATDGTKRFEIQLSGAFQFLTGATTVNPAYYFAPGNQTLASGGNIYQFGGNTITHTNAITDQSFAYFGNSTITSSSAVTITNAGTLWIHDIPSGGGSNTITNAAGLYINQTGGGNRVTNGYGIYVETPTGATNNYAATFTGGSVGIGDATPDALLDLDSIDTDGGDFLITNTGIGLSGTVAGITSNSTTTGDIFTISATGLTTGTALTLTGPSSTGVTDHFAKFTADVGSAAALIYGAPDFSGSAVTGYGLNITATDSTANANTDYAGYFSLALTGNAGKTGVGAYSTVTSASTTADTLVSLDLATDVTGIMAGAGTRNVYGLRTQPSAGAESTAGTTNVYGVYSKVTADVAAGGTINGYGLYIANGTYDTDGTSTQYGLHFEALSGADTNIDINAVTSLDFGIGGTSEITLDGTSFSPTTSDGNALGTTSLMWSDLFLASGGVINFNNGDVTLTHGTDALTLGGGSLTVTGSEGSNQLVLTAGDAAISDGSLSITDDDNAVSLQLTNNTITTGNLANITSTSLTTGSAFKVEVDGLTTGNALEVEQDNRDMLALTDRDLTVGGHTDLTTQTTITNTFVYDTGKDMDGGAWTDDGKSRGSSWYNETIDNTAPACSLDTDDRCGQRAFPKKALLVVTTTKLYIYDAKDNTLWMDFRKGATTTEQMIGPTTNSTGSVVFALNGKVYYGNNGSVGGLYIIDFKNDTAQKFNTTNDYVGNLPISSRNSTISWNPGPSGPLNGTTINDVHSAYINGKTYTAVATDDAASVIHENDNVVYDYDEGSADDINAVWIDKKGTLWLLNESRQKLRAWRLVNKGTADLIGGSPGFYNSTGWVATGTTVGIAGTVAGPAIWPSAPTFNNTPDALWVTDGTSTADNGGSPTVYVAHNAGLTVINTNVQNESNGSAKYYTNTYITEEMIGDIRTMIPMIETASLTTSGTDIADRSYQANRLMTNAITTNSITSATGAVRGTGLTLDGTDDYLCADTNDDGSNVCDDNADFDFTAAQNFSIGIWFKHNTISTTEDYLVTKGDGTVQGYKVWMDASGDMCFGVDDDATWTPDDQACTSSIDYDDNNWHHLTAVKQGTTALRLYVDGVLVASDTAIAATGTLANAGALNVGADSTPVASTVWAGSVDELMITAEALTASQVRQTYSVGLSALQNHSSSDDRDDDGTAADADTLQNIFGSTNNVSSVAVDTTRSYIYLGTRESSDGANDGGVSAIGVHSDSRAKTYSINGAQADDDGTTFANDDIISLSITGPVQPDTSCTTSNCSTRQIGGTLVIGTDGDFWAENKDTSFQDFMANAFNPFGESLVQTNLWVNGLFEAKSANNLSLNNVGSTLGTVIRLNPNIIYRPNSEVENAIAYESARTIYDQPTNALEIAQGNRTLFGVNSRDLTVGGKAVKKVAGLGSTSGAIQMFVYDTTKDPDGGKWTDDDRARASSWYNWGEKRGASHSFPKVAILVGGNNLDNEPIFIYDAKDFSFWAQVGPSGGSDKSLNGNIFAYNGKIYISEDGNSVEGVTVFDFINDKRYRWAGSCGAGAGGNLCDLTSSGGVLGGAPNNPSVDGADLVHSITDLSSRGRGKGIHAQMVNGKTYFVQATDSNVLLVNETDQTARVYSDVSNDDYNAVWLDKEGNLWALNDTQDQLELWKKVVNDSASEANGTPDKVWDQASTPALSNTTPSIQSNSPQNLWVTDGTSTVDGKSQTVYVGTDQGVTVVNTNRADESNSSVKYITKDWISEEMVGDVRGMWHLTDNAASATVDDVTLKANDLTLYADTDGTPSTTANTSTVTASAIRGKGFDLDGSSHFLYKTDDDFNFTTENFTVSMWVNADSFATNSRTLLTFGDNSTTGYDLELTRVSDSQATVTFKTYQAGPASQSTTSSSGVIATALEGGVTNPWFHIAVVRSGTSARIYINGHDDTATAGTHTNPVTATGSNLVIGAKQNGASQWYDGQIDEVMITAEAISPSQVKKMYDVGFKAKFNHESSDTDNDGSNDSDTIQALYGSTNTVRSIALDPGNSYMYVAANDGAGGGGVTVLGLNTDTREEVYSNDNSTTNRDTDDGTADVFGSDDWVSVSVGGNIRPEAQRPGAKLGGYLALSNALDELWMESKDTSFQDFAKNNYNPFGETLFQNNLNVASAFAVGTQWLPANATSGIRSTEMVQNSIFRVDGIGDVILGANNNQANGAGANKSVRLTFNALDNSATPLLESASLWYDSVNNDIRTNAASGITTTQQTYDIAEDFPTRDSSIEAGDLVAVDKEASSSAYIAKSNKEYQNDLIGIVSTNPGFRLSQEEGVLENPVKVALAGRVPVKVNTENGPIEKGDYLTSSSTPGVAMRATKPGPTVGKALEAYNNEGVGKILVFVNVSWADPGQALANLLLDEQGNLVIPKVKTASLEIGPIGPTSPIGQIEESTALDVASKLRVIDEAIATQSAYLAQAKAEIASASAELARTKSDIDLLKLTPPEILLATGSATLANIKATDTLSSEKLLTALDVTVSGVFKALGESFLGNTLIAGDLIIDGTFSIDNGSELNAIPTLYIQKNSLASSLNILNGKFIFDKEGKLVVAGTVEAEQFSVTSGKSAGTAKILAGQTEIIVENEFITENSLVLITPEIPLTQTLAVTNKSNKTNLTNAKFTVKLNHSETEDITFSYLIIGQGVSGL